MLMTMEPDLQRNLENLGAYDMLQELKTLFSQQAEQELLQTEYDTFVQNCNMHGIEKMINELHAMLKLHDQTLPKTDAPALDAIRAGKGLRGSRKLMPRALSLYMGNGQRAAVEAIGSYYLCFPSGLVIILHNCHYAHSITRGVISVSHLYGDGFINHFNGNTISVSRNNVVYFSAVPRDGIYEIDLFNSNTNNSSMYAVSNKRAMLNLDSTLLWHCRLGHISKKCIEKLQHDGLLNSTNIKSFEKCVSCMSGKMAQKPYSHQAEWAKDLLGLIHTDVCCPFRIVSRQGANYFITFTEDFSRYGYVYLLKYEHDVFETFKVFQKEVENQLRMTIKALCSDHGGEYMSQEFLDHLKEHGIIAHHTPLYTLQHNGVSERRNRTILDMVRSMMSQTILPKSFWDYALESVARILNMVPTKKVEKTPYEVWHGQAPKMSYLKVWGYEALVKRYTLTKPDKLEPKSIKCIFLGYPKETMGYSFYYPPENKVFVARNAEFLKDDSITQEASESLEDLEIIQKEDTHPSEKTSIHHDEDRMCLYIDDGEYELGGLNEPGNYKAALLDPELDKWLDAMNVEMKSMKDNEVWDLVDLPPNGKTIGSKWLFKKKTGIDGAVHTYKARLVAKGFTQTYGVDYKETFSPIADIRAIRILIAIAAFYDYKIYKWMSKLPSSMDISQKRFIWCNLKVLSIQNIQTEYGSSSVPFRDLSKHQGNGINDLMMKLRNLVSLKIMMSHVYI
ncbi:retrotransposon protein, putative, ty1-copia subclass [Tanacetum coccineum]